MQSLTRLLPEHMAIVGGELAHVREAPTGGNFHYSFPLFRGKMFASGYTH